HDGPGLPGTHVRRPPSLGVPVHRRPPAHRRGHRLPGEPRRRAVIDGDARLEWLAQREDLRSLPQRYARAIDARDIDAVAALFDPEGTVDGARGPASVPDYVEMLRQSGPAFQTTMHVLGDPLISHEPGSATAHLDTYAVVH